MTPNVHNVTQIEGRRCRGGEEGVGGSQSETGVCMITNNNKKELVCKCVLASNE